MGQISINEADRVLRSAGWEADQKYKVLYLKSGLKIGIWIDEYANDIHYFLLDVFGREGFFPRTEEGLQQAIESADVVDRRLRSPAM